ncbi:hypothetical protein V1477_018725 [Vespula maculifrons]|uniref:Uncharacterized protein n=1 Tax=Vespula maculifrons TaxID=7453 RepID=A0ABD2AW67_VESMC
MQERLLSRVPFCRSKMVNKLSTKAFALHCCPYTLFAQQLSLYFFKFIRIPITNLYKSSNAVTAFNNA